MKKILYTLLLLIVTLPYASAGIKESETTDNAFLLKTNYSESTARIIDTIRARNNYDDDFYYQRVYNSKYPEDGIEYAASFYDRIKAWFDPMADDHFFGEHEINFYNKFLQMEPSYKDYLDRSRAYNKGYRCSGETCKGESL